MRKPALKRVETVSDEGGGAAPELAEAQFADAMLRALRSAPRSIEPKFFYDEAGSALFERICELPEYYLTRAETAILRARAGEVARLIGPRADLVEFGAGSPLKARIVLDALQAPARYTPVDLAAAQMDAAARELERAYPGLEVTPLAADFAQPLTLPALVQRSAGRRVGLFFGSTIGNLAPEQAQDFLAGAAALLEGGALLIGVDLVKDPAVLHRAYNDAQGVTAAFNRNLLVRANRELGSDFDPSAFDHYAFYQTREQRIEMHLVSARRQTVRLTGHAFEFAQGESLHTENSYKYTVDGFRDMARRAGMRPGPVWIDGDGCFSLHWLEAARPG